MTSDSIPLQAGPGAGADQLPDGEPLEALRRIYSHAMFGDRGNPNRMWRLLHAEVRALAVEDSRERSSDARMLTNEDLLRIADSLPRHPWGIGSRSSDAFAFVRAAMAAASSGKEKME